MDEPFKEVFNRPALERMAVALATAYPRFEAVRFLDLASAGLSDLELKERSLHISKALKETLPSAFPEVVEIMLSSLGGAYPVDGEIDERNEVGLSGFIVMPFTDYVMLHGLEHFDLSLAALKNMTSRFSGEFAIRAFLEGNRDRTLELLSEWCDHEDKHVRRLVSEGSRPRLPWAPQLKQFMADPSYTLPFLERLKDDPSEYVRRSVANHLNDISKDHPDVVADVCAKWLEGASKERVKLVRHALRSNIKAAHQPTLKALGYDCEGISVARPWVQSEPLIYGGALRFGIELVNDTAASRDYMLDFIIYHQKANGKLAPKVFKWRKGKLEAGQMLRVDGKHSIRPITTRKYYAGEHKVCALLNGVEHPMGDFELVMETEELAL
ncbi:hypothetical protein [Pseudovibrio sp. Tun.PSC04-5.I4]|uniref:hypothetical protein n=1 Tax=Pseudovibrio sp. Tun.PSC04-5.I4 TaxID=1798213 RepID=UPI00087EAD7C|nr:hypothetical protein [Pseudovibrio sp. Tun.PSC04-5.I4]SDR29845.1 3-methyladenine DNA glycosylase AlkC [Pseudovibrio sp. Tun.PSC04-5.I4]